MLQSVKTFRREGQDAPENVKIDTPFSVGQRLNVEYDLPRKTQRSAYASAIEVSQGKTLGVFEVTDIYRNMLVNPNFTMIELTSRDENFDKLHINDKTFLIEEDVLLRRHRFISRDMIVAGLQHNLIVPTLEDGELVAKIGDNWFYFGGSEFEHTNPKDIPFEILVEEIKCVLDDFEGEYEFNDEYLYYYFHLTELLKTHDLDNSKGSVSDLIDDAKKRVPEVESVASVKDDVIKE